MDRRAYVEVTDIGKRMPMILLVPRQIRFPTRAHRDGETWGDLEFVLEIEEMLPLHRIAARLSEDDAQLVEDTEHIFGHRVARQCAADCRTARVGELTVGSKIHLIYLLSP